MYTTLFNYAAWKNSYRLLHSSIIFWVLVLFFCSFKAYSTMKLQILLLVISLSCSVKLEVIRTNIFIMKRVLGVKFVRTFVMSDASSAYEFENAVI